MVNFFLDPSPLRMGDAVALILVTEDGHYVLQHRDDIEAIWYPNKWGCFGGGTEEGETPIQALEREIEEEIGFIPENMKPFCSLDFDMSDSGSRVFYRRYYCATISPDQIDKIKIGEGRTYRIFSAKQLDSEIPLVPYDEFALLLHHKKSNVFSG